MKLRAHITGIALVLAAGSALSAQEVTGTFTGSVRGADGQALSGAIIRIAGAGGIQDRSVTSDSTGGFRVPLLLPGDYTVTVSKDGYLSAKVSLRVSGGQVVRQDFNLKTVGAAAATVEVVAVATQVDKTQTKVATTITQDDMAEIPLANSFVSRGLAGLVLAPSTTGNQLYQSVRGGGQGQTQYLVNGLSVRDNITMQGRPQDTILDDLIEESQVILSPLNAKYGDSSAGLVNIIERTGGNEYTGSVRIRLDRGTWQALYPAGYNRNGRVASTFQQTPTDSLSRQYEIAVTGPIIKDKLTFTYGTRLTPSSLSSVTAGTTTMRAGSTFTRFQGATVAADIFSSGQIFTGNTKFSFHQGRLYWQITPNHSLDYSHSENKNLFFDYNGNTLTPLSPSEIDTAQSSVTKFRQLAYRGLFGPNHVIEARYGKRDSKIKFTSGPGDPIQLGYGPSTMTGLAQANTFPFIGGGTADSQPEGRDTESAVVNYTGYFNAAGSHTLDIGLNYIKVIWGTVQNSGGPNGRIFFVPGKLNTGNPNTGFIVFPHNAIPTGANIGFVPTYTEYTGVEQAELVKPSTAFYINDQWTVNNHWSFMFGVRMEKYSYEDGLGERYNSSSVSPRLEAKWDIGGDQQRILAFSYGQFRGNVGERITREYSKFRRTTVITRYWSASGGAGVTDYQVDRAAVLNPANYGLVVSFNVPDAIYDIDKSFKPEVNHEYVLSYRRAFANGGWMSASLVHRNWEDLANAFGSLTPISIPDPTGSGLPAKTNYKRVLVNDPEAKRAYNGFEVEFRAPIIPGKLNLGGSYAFSRTTANSDYGDSTGFALTQVQAQRGYFRDRFDALGIPREAIEPDGLLPTSLGHSLRLLLTYNVNFGRVRSTFSLLGRYFDGSPERFTQTVLIPGSNSSQTVSGLDPTFPASPTPLPTSYTHFYNGRAPFTSPYFHSLDFGYNLNIPFGKLEFFTEISVVNVLNNIRPGALDRTMLGGTRATAADGPRISNAVNYGHPTSNTFFSGARDFNLTLGMRF